MTKNKPETYFSNAKWTEIGESDDSHSNFEMAKGVCLRLLWDYGNIPCKLRGYCRKVWVTDSNGRVLFEQAHEEKFIPSYAPQNLKRDL